VLFPALGALFGWLGWEIVLERLAGARWQNAWLFAFVLATLAGLVLLFIAALAWTLRARLTIDAKGVTLRGLFRTRAIPWHEFEGYRWIKGELCAYPAGDEFPLGLAYFENQELIRAWIAERLKDLRAAELEQEDREISADTRLGLREEEKAAELGRLQRIVRPVNWLAYIAVAIGAVNALFFGHPGVRIAAALALILAPVVLVALALGHRDHVRLDFKEGTRYPEAASGVMAGGLGLAFISALDTHTLLGERVYPWTFALAALAAGLWLHVEWPRIRALRSWVAVLPVASYTLLSGFWAGGTVYQLNQIGDASAPVWRATSVTSLRESKHRGGRSYYVKVESWDDARAGALELEVPRGTYRVLRAGMPVEVGVRRGALDIPWVEAVRLKKPSG
jgi:hypothetical protein